MSRARGSGGLVVADLTRGDVLEDEGIVLGRPIRAHVSPFHAPDGDRVACLAAPTESLTDDAASGLALTGVGRDSIVMM